MKKGRKGYLFKRFGLGLIQHFAAAFVLVLLAMILFNSYLTINAMNERKTYSLNPLSQKSSFEESDIFQDLFQSSVKDVIHLGVIKEQMEINGKFNSSKVIDVTSFLNRYGEAGKDYGNASAKYELENLILWNRFGLEYKIRSMSLSEFVNYFEYACAPENFKLDEHGSLTFTGYHNVKEYNDDYYARHLTIIEKMANFTESQLEDMAFSYIMGKVSDGITLNKEDDGNLTVYVNVLYCKYATTNGKTSLYDLVDNWIDFMSLQSNVAEASQMLAKNFELYQNSEKYYAEGKGNLKYLIRMPNEKGKKETFSNVSGLVEMDEDSLTEYFEENNRYLIYYPNSLEIMGNSDFTESNIYELLKETGYPTPEEVYIWMSLDTSYEVKGDVFSVARNVYESIVPNMTGILTIMVILCITWISLLTYLTVTTGVTADNETGTKRYLNAFDRIWTEIYVALVTGAGFGTYQGILYLKKLTLSVYENRLILAQDSSQNILYQYGAYALFGFATSMILCLLWYSLVRRLKAFSIYQDSLLHHAINGIYQVFEMVMAHQSSMISVLLPYVIFLLVNFFALIGIIFFKAWGQKILVMAVLLIVDVVVGARLFKKNAEFNDIIEGINRIRGGESDYKLDSQKLHGMNKFLADAVNNIGDGIDNAVKTSVKDERLKTDLITNVSHDLKTPLTSIINYVDLLKRADVKDPQARSYVSILEGKAQRLKDLTDDLVEASKISSGNITLNMEVINLGELLMQTIGELSEKLEAANLKVVAEVDEKPALIYADSRRMWRVMENLFNNICKYAMEGTRVYSEVQVEGEEVRLSIKNVSKAQMNIHADELTERFIRGDSSRSTEGSGLGLYIAKSLTNVLGGSFEIQLEADLFKVNIKFPLHQEEKLPKEQESGSEESL